MKAYPTFHDRLVDVERSFARQRWFNVLFLAMLLFLIGWNIAKGQSPASELSIALEDLEQNTPALLAPTTRYLTLYAVPEVRRAEAAAVISFMLNSVSRSPVVIVPTPHAGGRLLKINLTDYGIDPKLWELLAQEDPYWHLQTDVIDPQSAKQRTVYTDGGWVDLKAAERMRALTGSGGAILRADFFVARMSTTVDGGHYYRFAGIPEKELDWFKLLGLDVEVVRALQAEEGANLIRSGITQKFRRVKRRQGPLGAVWKTYDVARNSPERDPLRNPFGFTYDAGEQIAAKANGLHLFALYSAAGERQDFVPPDVVAGDTSDPHAKSPVAPLISCVRCHVEDGLRPFGNDQRRLLTGAVDLYVEDPTDAQKLASFYERDTERRLARDREDFGLAVARATGGMDTKELAAALADLFAAYADELVGAEDAARELGISPDQIKPRLAGSHDPVLLALCEGIEVAREQWAASFAEAALLSAEN